MWFKCGQIWFTHWPTGGSIPAGEHIEAEPTCYCICIGYIRMPKALSLTPVTLEPSLLLLLIIISPTNPAPHYATALFFF